MPDEMYKQQAANSWQREGEFSLFLDGLAFSRASALLAPEGKRHSQADHELMAAVWSSRSLGRSEAPR